MKRRTLSNNEHLKKDSHPRTAEGFFAKSQRFRDAYSKSVSVIARMRSEHLSLRKAALHADIDPRTVKRIASSALRKDRHGRYAAKRNDKLLRILLTPTANGLREIAVVGLKNARLVAEHANALRRYVQTGDASPLKQFHQKSLGARAAKITLLTNLVEIDRLANAGVLSFENLYSRRS